MESTLYIGTYTHGDSKGIYRAVLRDGTPRIAGCTEAVNPSYLAIHGDRLYAVRETEGGGVASYRVAPGGEPALVGERPVAGDAPCHLCVAGNLLCVSNYGSGTLSVFELDGEGEPAPLPRVIAHRGRGPHAERQRAPHVHQALPTPDGSFLAVCDLGIDAVCFYPLNAQMDAQGIREPAQSVPMPGGAGPRHAAFGPHGCWYVLCELSCQVLAYRGYGDDAKLIQRCDALRDGDPESIGAAVRLSPDGRLLLASIRGANTLALWDVSPEGALSGARWADARGDGPRDAAFTPDGTHVLCACERDDRVTVFALRDAALEFVGAVAVPMPTCVCFAP